jgi:hypothetical protein
MAGKKKKGEGIIEFMATVAAFNRNPRFQKLVDDAMAWVTEREREDQVLEELIDSLGSDSPKN